MSDVFVSYKAEDRERLRPLVAALEAEGLSVWWDAHISGGDEWRDAIARQLDEARCVIVAWSKRSIGPDGHFVRDEAGRAVKRHVYLPVTIDKVDPPLGFGETQCLPLAGWKGDRGDPRWEAVRDAVRSRLGLKAEANKVPSAKPMQIDRRALLGAGGVAAIAAAGGLWMFRRSDGGTPDSVAVLPFANLSGDPAQAYFSDGMAEELRNALARIPGLKVVARTSSEMLRDSDAKAAAGKLGVATILTGSVRRSPSTIRVSAQLIDGSNGIERWSQSFDRPAGDLLQVQTSIAENVAQQLRGQFARGDRSGLVVAGTRNAEAQDLVLQAEAAQTNGDEAGFRHALALADAAIALDPKYVEALAMKARVTALLASYYARTAGDNRAGLERAAVIARQAIAIDPQVPQAYAALALVRRNQLDMGASLAALAKATSLPGAPSILTAIYASALSDNDQFDPAMRLLQTAADRDPLNPELPFVKAMTFARARHYDEAIPLFEQYLQALPKQIQGRYFYASSLLFAGRTSDAARQFALLPASDFHRLVGEAAIAARAGDKATAKRNSGLIYSRYGSAANYQYAQIAAQSGDVETGIAALNAAWAERDPGLPAIKVDSYLDPLRKDPRFAAVVAKLNFPAA